MINILNLSRTQIGVSYASIASIIQSLSANLLAGNSSFTSASLIGTSVLVLFREIVPYTQGDIVGDRVFTFDSATGTVTFDSPNGNPVDPQVVYVLYYPTPVSGPAVEPVTLTEAKTQLRVTFSDDDAEILALISKARAFIENYCNNSIVAYRVTLVGVFSSCWELPYGPVTGIESVSSPVGNGGSGPVAYETTTHSWDSEGDWFNGHPEGKYRVVYTTGMSSVPYDLKQAILVALSYMYENRGKVTAEDMCTQALGLANPYRKVQWI